MPLPIMFDLNVSLQSLQVLKHYTLDELNLTYRNYRKNLKISKLLKQLLSHNYSTLSQSII